MISNNCCNFSFKPDVPTSCRGALGHLKRLVLFSASSKRITATKAAEIYLGSSAGKLPASPHISCSILYMTLQQSFSRSTSSCRSHWSYMAGRHSWIPVDYVSFIIWDYFFSFLKRISKEANLGLHIFYLNFYIFS